MTSPGPVVINLPPREQAPAYRRSLSQLGDLDVQDFGTSVVVSPREGAGATREFFKAVRLCGDGDVLTDETWAPLREHPPRDHDPTRTEQLVKWAQDRVAAEPTNMWQLLRSFRACVFVLGSHLAEFLQRQIPLLFQTFPGASLWLVRTDPVLLARLAFLRTQVALALTPDITLSGDEFEGLRLLEAHSLTTGTDFGSLYAPPVLAFSPGVVGLPLSAPPHALVLFLGQTLDLRKPEGPTWADLFRPRTLDRPENWNDPAFWDGLDFTDVEAFLPWWVQRLNVLYSHASDPTGFHDDVGRHDAAAQTAWLLTLERMLADGILLLSDMKAAGAVRLQLAFDLLDKAESLLKYRDSGAGFKDLLRRSKTVPRLNQAWASLPGGLTTRFQNHTTLAFDLMYEDIREHALTTRTTRNGMLVARDHPARATPMPMDEYVAELVRGVRNSSHGLARLLRENDALLLGTHEGRMPSQLADVAALVMLGLVAEADQLCAGTWW
jgi:hypothetical protein